MQDCMSEPIWPVVTENLAEQIAATQSGLLHPSQLLPYLPLSLEQIEKTLDGLLATERVFKDKPDGLLIYTFVEFLDHPVREFKPDSGVYSDDPLEPEEHTAVSAETRKQIEFELSNLAAADPWPAAAVWQHELIYLIQNLPSPVSLSAIAGHSRLPFRKVEEKLKTLQKCGAVHLELGSGSYTAAPITYPKNAYRKQDAFIRQFPGALKEEDEIRLIKGLFAVFAILAICCIVAVTAKIPFPFLFISGLIAAGFNFIRIIKAAPKPLPEI